MFSIKAKIFSYFGVFDKVNDINKDANDKGTHERFTEIYAGYLDTEILPLIDNLAANNLDNATVLVKYLPYREYEKGVDFTLYPTEVWRRRVLKNIQRWHEIKGTKRGYKAMFNVLGLTMTLTEIFGIYGFDSPTTFDDPVRRFDGRCAPCSSYSIALTGYAPMSPALDAAIEAVILFNEPINAILYSWNYTQITSGSFNNSFSNSFN